MRRQLHKYVAPKPPRGYDSPPSSFSVSIGVSQDMLGDPTDGSAKMHSFMQSLPETDRTLMLWQSAGAQRWVEQGFVSLFPTGEITHACKHTDAMKSIIGSDIRTTYPSFMVTLPRSERLINDKGYSVSHIIVNVYDDQRTIIAKFGDEQDGIRMPGDRHLLMNLYWTDLGCQSISVPLSRPGTLGKEFEAIADLGALESEISPRCFLTTEDDARIGWEVAEMVANMMLVMQSYPQYITRSSVKHRKPGEKKARGTVTRLLLGRTSGLRQKVSHIPSSGEVDGHPGRTVRSHIRRGHWRRQRHLSDWEMDHPDVAVVIMPDGIHAHMTWIEPLWIGARDDD